MIIQITEECMALDWTLECDQEDVRLVTGAKREAAAMASVLRFGIGRLMFDGNT